MQAEQAEVLCNWIWSRIILKLTCFNVKWYSERFQRWPKTGKCCIFQWKIKLLRVTKIVTINQSWVLDTIEILSPRKYYFIWNKFCFRPIIIIDYKSDFFPRNKCWGICFFFLFEKYIDFSCFSLAIQQKELITHFIKNLASYPVKLLGSKNDRQLQLK